MRLAVLILTSLLALSGCTGNVGQAIPSSERAAAGPGGTIASGRAADLDAVMSPAARTLLDQGRAQRLAGDFSKASASLERAVRIEPDQPVVWLELGQLRFDEGNYAQAEQMARKSMSLAPERSSVELRAARLIADAQFARSFSHERGTSRHGVPTHRRLLWPTSHSFWNSSGGRSPGT